MELLNSPQNSFHLSSTKIARLMSAGIVYTEYTFVCTDLFQYTELTLKALIKVQTSF